MSKVSIRYVISDVHMGQSHDGLTAIIREHKRKNPMFAQTMASGGLVLFLNKTETRAKLFSDSGEVLAYLRMPGDRKITQDGIEALTRTFGGSAEYSRAAAKKIKEVVANESKPNKRSYVSQTVLHAEG